jgi:hypothetical protein
METNINNTNKILVRTYGSKEYASVEFYKIVGKKSETIYYVQKSEKKMLLGGNSVYLIILDKVGQSFRSKVGQ